MERNDSVPAVSQPKGGKKNGVGKFGTRRATSGNDGHCNFTTLCSSGMVINFEPNSTPSLRRGVSGTDKFRERRTNGWVWVRQEASVGETDEEGRLSDTCIACEATSGVAV